MKREIKYLSELDLLLLYAGGPAFVRWAPPEIQTHMLKRFFQGRLPFKHMQLGFCFPLLLFYRGDGNPEIEDPS